MIPDFILNDAVNPVNLSLSKGILFIFNLKNTQNIY